MSDPVRTLTLAITSGRNLSTADVDNLLDAFKAEIIAGARANLMAEIRVGRIDDAAERKIITDHIDQVKASLVAQLRMEMRDLLASHSYAMHKDGLGP